MLEEAIALGEGTGAARAVAHASLVRLLVRLRAGDSEKWRDDAATTIAEAMAMFQQAADHAGLAKAWRLLAWTHGTANDFGNAAEASARAVDHARRAGDRRQQSQAATAYAAAAVFGPTPVQEAISRFELISEEVSDDRHSQGVVLALRGSLEALQGSFEDARELVARGCGMLEELGLDVRLARLRLEAWRVEMFAGRPTDAEQHLRNAYGTLAEVGDRYLLGTVAGLLGQTLYDLGRFDEIAPLVEEARSLALPDDVDTQALWRCIQGKLLARQGFVEEGETLVREALATLAPTDAVLFKYGAFFDLAEVLRLAGNDEEVRTALHEAIHLGELKQSRVMVSGARAALATLDAPSLIP
jgi:tetratricopeptide (TPR) repeat protein